MILGYFQLVLYFIPLMIGVYIAVKIIDRP